MRLRKTLCLILCLCLLAGVLPAAASAAEAETASALRFQRTVAVADTRMAAVRSDGTVWQWGSVRVGEDPVLVPESVPGLKDVVSVETSAWSGVTYAITADRTLWNWGGSPYDSSFGAFGREVVPGSGMEPGVVMGGVRDVSTGVGHTLALGVDGTLWAWGDNSSGQLGNGRTGTVYSWGDIWDDTVYEALPVKVMQNVVAISAGNYYSAAITADGSLWTWGDNSDAQLGFGLGGNDLGREDFATGERDPIQTVPVKVMENVAQVVAGSSSTAVLKTDGSLWALGGRRVVSGEAVWDEERGMLTWTDDYKTEPIAEPRKLMDGVVNIQANSSTYAAIHEDGSLWTWGGRNMYGILGRGKDLEPEDCRTPGKVLDGVAEVVVGNNCMAAVKYDGSLWTWGWNYAGVLGDGTEETAYYPVKVLKNVAIPASVRTPENSDGMNADILIAGSTANGSKTAPPVASDIPDGALSFNGHAYMYYFFENPVRWDDAEAFCESLGGHLATITSPEEQEVLTNGNEDFLWIGGRWGIDGGWTWVTGEAWSYSAWNEGEPNNYGGGENYVSVRPVGWNDCTMDSSEVFGLICEWDHTADRTQPAPAPAPAPTPVTANIPDGAAYFNGNAYVYYSFEGIVTWDDAEAFCESLGGHLATITYPEEQAFLTNGNETIRWIGARRDGSGAWTWVTGENWSYSAWNEGEPNNYGGNEGYAAVRPVGWNDCTADSSEVGGLLCEWEQAAGHTKPVPAPDPLPDPAPDSGAYVAFDANGGSVSTARIAVSFGQEFGPLPVAYRDGYTFDGWYSEPDGGDPITEFRRALHSEGTLTVYAHWTANRAPAGVEDLSFRFINSQQDFGYPDGYRFPLEAFQYYFGAGAYAESIYNFYTGWGGSCWGMSMSASLIYEDNEVGLRSFRADARTPAELELGDWSDAARTNLFGMIELNQISALSAPVQKEYARHKNQYAGLVEKTLDFQFTGNHPVIVSMWGPRDENGSRNAHATVAYAVYRNPGENFDRVYVYDPNWPEDGSRYIAMYRDADNRYTGWYYHMNDWEDWGSAYDEGFLNYATYDVYYPVWYYRGWEEYQSGVVTVNVPNAAILDYAGNEIARIRDGELLSDRPDVFPLERIDGESAVKGEGLTFCLPRDYFQIVNEDETISELRVTVTSGDHSAAVTTGAGRVLCYTDWENGTDAVLVDGDRQPYEIVFRSGSAEEATSASVSGVTGEGRPAFLARQNGTLCYMGIDPEESELTLDGSPADKAVLQPSSIAAVVAAAQPNVVSAVFTDVSGEAYYAPAVQWALDRGVTEGTAPGFFSPEGTSSRAQAVTLLWRAMGMPEPVETATQFADVPDNAWYAEAVAWAVGAGIVNGTDATHFSPDDLCTNAHILTMLWRTMGRSMETGEGTWYTDALTWAETAGIAADVVPADSCPRRDAVTWLFRAIG